MQAKNYGNNLRMRDQNQYMELQTHVNTRNDEVNSKTENRGTTQNL